MSGSAPILLSVGATGSIGRYVVQEGLHQGYQVRALVRTPDSAGELPRQVEVVVGDLTQPNTLDRAVYGIQAVVFTHGAAGGNNESAQAVDYGGVRNILAALGARGARIALMTAIGVTDRRGAHDWKRRGERLVRASGLPYTIVRPGWFDYNTPDQHRLVLLQGDRRQSGTPGDGAIARQQLAQVLVHSLQAQSALAKTFELVAEIGPETSDLDALFATVDPDVRRALDGAHDAHNMPLESEPKKVVSDLDKARERWRPSVT